EHPDEVIPVEAATLAESLVPSAANGHPAARWHERAARRLMTRGRYESAVRPLERALALEQDPARRAELWFHLSSALLRSGRPEDLEQAIRSALAEDPPPGARARLLVNEHARLTAAGQAAGAIASVEQALALAEEADDDEARGLASTALFYTALQE